MLIRLLRVYSVGEVSTLARRIQKNPWNIGNRGYMKYLQGYVLILPSHFSRLELRYVIPQSMMD
jgi:hypothetical protein